MNKIKRVGVVGAGTMGSGIAQKIAQEGFNVIISDVKQEFLDKGLNNIKKLLDEALKRKIFNEHQINDVLNRIKLTTDINDLANCDIIIEAIFEDEKAKSELFLNLGNICKKETILASNTSTIPITRLGEISKRPDRFIGLHYFFHPAKNRLLEIIPGNDTSQETIELASKFSDSHGKTAISVKDSPGFAVNRFFVPWLNEAVRLLDENIANISTIEKVAKETFKIGMGPFELMNVTGIPIAYHSCVSLEKELGKFYGPSPRLEKQFKSNQIWDLNDGDYREDKKEIIKNRMLGTVFYVAAELVHNDVVSIEDIDIGAKVGLRWSNGPFELMNKFGIDYSLKTVNEFCDLYEFSTPNVLINQSKIGMWTFNLVDLKINNRMGIITFKRPDAMNAINETVVMQLNQRIDEAEKSDEVDYIVLKGAGKAFVAGADIKFFVDCINDCKINNICKFTEFGHNTLLKLDKSKKPVVAWVDGLALGGGAEIALASDYILVTNKATVGFPETGIGIYPGLGGTQRLSKKTNKSVARYLILTGKIITAEEALNLGVADKMVTPDDFKKIPQILKQFQQNNTPKEIEDIPYLKLFNDENIEDLLANKLINNELASKLLKKISYKAPIAVKKSLQLINDGYKLPIEEGIKLELNGLTDIFSTNDALEGLNSVINRQRPSFTGK